MPQVLARPRKEDSVRRGRKKVPSFHCDGGMTAGAADHDFEGEAPPQTRKHIKGPPVPAFRFVRPTVFDLAFGRREAARRLGRFLLQSPLATSGLIRTHTAEATYGLELDQIKQGPVDNANSWPFPSVMISLCSEPAVH